jgi:hypothetical protein
MRKLELSSSWTIFDGTTGRLGGRDDGAGALSAPAFPGVRPWTNSSNDPRWIARDGHGTGRSRRARFLDASFEISVHFPVVFERVFVPNVARSLNPRPISRPTSTPALVQLRRSRLMEPPSLSIPTREASDQFAPDDRYRAIRWDGSDPWERSGAVFRVLSVARTRQLDDRH